MKKISIRLEDKQLEWIRDRGSPTEVIRGLIDKAMNIREDNNEGFPECSNLMHHKFMDIHYCLNRIKAKTILPKHIRKAKVTPYDCQTCLEIKKRKMPQIENKPKKKAVLTSKEKANEYFNCSYKNQALKIIDLPCIKDVNFNCPNKLCEKQIMEQYLK